MKNANIKIVKRNLTFEEYNHIRQAAGLSKKPENGVRTALRNTLFSVCVELDNKTIGIGRVIGDGGCFFEIVDVAVDKDFQGIGVGNAIMQSIMEYLELNAPKGSFISLIAGEGVSSFYEKYGFNVRPPSKPAMSMVKS